jgi:hypothetical protein
MVRIRYNHNWPRRGLALIWDAETLAELVTSNKVLSMRQFFALAGDWPEDLPAADGDAIVVAGLEGCIDVLDAKDVERWIETDLKEVVLSFQDYYEGQAGLIFWLPSGRNRISMKGATEQYFWKHRDSGSDGIAIGRLLFSGAENEVERILNTDDPNADYDGKHWAGLHHPRIS